MMILAHSLPCVPNGSGSVQSTVGATHPQCTVRFTARARGPAAALAARPPQPALQRLVVRPAAAVQNEPAAAGDNWDVPPLSSGRRGGRPARRLNPLGHSALLSAYNASALREMGGSLLGCGLQLERLPDKTSYVFTHKEWQATALTHPSVLNCFGVGCLSSSHMAVLGEDLIRLAAIELSWSALQPPSAGAAAATAGAASALGAEDIPSSSAGGPPGAPSKAPESLLTAAASTVKKITEKLAHMAPDTWGPRAGADNGADESWELQLQCTAALLNKAAAAVAAAVPQLAEQWQIDQHMCGFGSPAGKQEKVTCCKALLAAAYLDGGYGAVRAMLGPWVVEVLRAAPERELQRTAFRIRQLLAKPQPASLLQDDPWALTTGMSGIPHTGKGMDAASADDTDAVTSALDVAVRGQYAPLADLHWHRLLGGLRLLGGTGEGYEPRDVDYFQEQCDLWYAYLCSSASTLLPSTSPASWLQAKGAERAATMERRSAAAKSLLALGGAVYGVMVSELVLERCLTVQAPDMRCPSDNKLRRMAADEVRRDRATLMQDATRLAQMEVGLGLCRPEAEGTATGGAGVYGTTQRDSVGSLLTRCTDGVVAAVALEGGLRRARQVVRGLVGVAEMAEVEARLQQQT